MKLAGLHWKKKETHVSSELMSRTCDNCGRIAPESEQMYTIRIEMFARAEPIEITLEDLLEDHTAKMEELLKQMEQLDPEEASDEIHESYRFDLCRACRRRIHAGLKAKWLEKQAEPES